VILTADEPKWKKFIKQNWPAISVLIILILLVALIFFHHARVESKLQKTRIAEAGLLVPSLLYFDKNDNVKIWDLVDENYGIDLTIVKSDYGNNPPIGISGLRYGPPKIPPANGNERIAITLRGDGSTFPAIYRYVNVTAKKIFYYETNHAATFAMNLN
jgi:hypothetical protein